MTIKISIQKGHCVNTISIQGIKKRKTMKLLLFRKQQLGCYLYFDTLEECEKIEKILLLGNHQLLLQSPLDSKELNQQESTINGCGLLKLPVNARDKMLSMRYKTALKQRVCKNFVGPCYAKTGKAIESPTLKYVASKYRVEEYFNPNAKHSANCIQVVKEFWQKCIPSVETSSANSSENELLQYVNRVIKPKTITGKKATQGIMIYMNVLFCLKKLVPSLCLNTTSSTSETRNESNHLEKHLTIICDDPSIGYLFVPRFTLDHMSFVQYAIQSITRPTQFGQAIPELRRPVQHDAYVAVMTYLSQQFQDQAQAVSESIQPVLGRDNKHHEGTCYGSNYYYNYLKSLCSKTCFINMPCGTGKTICAIKIACVLLETMVINQVLILVHMSDLVTQWDQNIVQLCGKEVSEKYFKIIMIQSVGKKKCTFQKSSENKHSLVIMDEVHHWSASNFHRCTSSVLNPTQHVVIIGLSAELTRKDGKMEIMTHCFGSPVYSIRMIELGRSLERLLVYNLTFTPDYHRIQMFFKEKLEKHQNNRNKRLREPGLESSLSNELSNSSSSTKKPKVENQISNHKEEDKQMISNKMDMNLDDIMLLCKQDYRDNNINNKIILSQHQKEHDQPINIINQSDIVSDKDIIVYNNDEEEDNYEENIEEEDDDTDYTNLFTLNDQSKDIATNYLKNFTSFQKRRFDNASSIPKAQWLYHSLVIDKLFIELNKRVCLIFVGSVWHLETIVQQVIIKTILNQTSLQNDNSHNQISTNTKPVSPVSISPTSSRGSIKCLHIDVRTSKNIKEKLLREIQNAITERAKQQTFLSHQSSNDQFFDKYSTIFKLPKQKKTTQNKVKGKKINISLQNDDCQKQSIEDTRQESGDNTISTQNIDQFKLIIATYHSTGEGVNMPDIDALVLADTPMNLQQNISRIRNYEKACLVYLSSIGLYSSGQQTEKDIKYIKTNMFQSIYFDNTINTTI